MSPAEVLGVEVQQYSDGVTKVLVPRVVGATAAAKAAKERGGGTPWNSTTFLATAMERCPGREVKMFERLFAHAEERGTKMSWGKGVSPGVSGWYLVSGVSRGVWTANAGTGRPGSSAYLYIWLPEITALVSENELASFLTVLRKIRAFDTEIASGKHKYPSVNLSAMSDEDVATFLEAVDTLTGPTSGSAVVSSAAT